MFELTFIVDRLYKLYPHLTGISEAAVGHFSSVLASMLNANYMSNEYFNAGALMRERRHNFSSNSLYSESNFDSDDVIPELREFCTDLKATIEAKSLVILFFSAAKTRPDVTLATGGKEGEKCYEHDSPTFDQLSRLEPFCHAFNARLSSEFQQSLSDEIPINDFSSKRICQYIRKETGADVLTIRVNIKTLRWADIEVYYRFIDVISEVVKSHLLKDSKRMTS